MSADHLEPAAPLRLRRAVLYLRVSTTSQVKTDYDPEGISLPAQREACRRKAEQLGDIVIVDEYKEEGKSATSTASRHEFQAMLRRIKDERDVDAVIVYKLSRMNRNRFDDAIVMNKLGELGVSLISATENIDDSPVGQLVHGVLASINQYQSAELSADIRYKMGEKAKKGGTLGRAPLGYRNVIDRFDGHEVRTVELDPERAELVRIAFELYATGEYTLEALSDELYDRGLRSRPGRYPATQVTDGKLAALLRNPYYLGTVVYKGQHYDGRHPALVDQTLFDEVQDLLASRKSRGERARKHNHPLKGLLWCGACHETGVERRMMFQRAKGRGGVYHYFFCRGRQDRTCDEPYLNVDHVETAVAEHYRSIRFDADLVELVRSTLSEAMSDDKTATRTLKKQLTKQLERLDTQETNLIELAADGLAAQNKIRSKLLKIERDRAALQGRLAAATEELQIGGELLTAAIDFLERADELYLRSTDRGRKVINDAIFEKIYVYRDDVVGSEMRFPVGQLVSAAEQVHRQSDRPPESKKPGPAQESDDRDPATDVDSLVQVLQDEGSSKATMVGVRGFEPPASTSRTWRANQAALHPVAGEQPIRPWPVLPQALHRPRTPRRRPRHPRPARRRRPRRPPVRRPTARPR